METQQSALGGGGGATERNGTGKGGYHVIAQEVIREGKIR